jgi:hypothetical protein
MKTPSDLKENAFAKIGVPIDKCRVCDNKFFEKALLRYENMPRAAQYL